MAQINLLKQKTAGQNMWETLPSIFVKVLLVVALGVLVYYGWLIYKINNVNKSITALKEQNASNISMAMSLNKRSEVMTRQSQLKEFDGILSRHVYWSHVWPELARVTLTSAGYTTLRGSTDGTLELSVSVPSFSELDKYLQVFDQAKYNENFSDIRMGGFHKISTGSGSAVKFDIRMKYNPELLIYKPSASK